MDRDANGLPVSSPAPAAPGVPGGGGAPTEQAQPQYITRDEAQRLAEAAADAAFRKAQGLTDKTASRLEKQVQERLAEIEKFVGPLTEEQKAKMASSLTQQEAAAPAANPQAATPTAVMDQAEIDRQTGEIYRRYGIELDDTDPEARLVESAKTPEAWLAALDKATAAKAARLKTPAQARVASFGGGAAADPVISTNNPDQLWKLANERGRLPRKG